MRCCWKPRPAPATNCNCVRAQDRIAHPRVRFEAQRWRSRSNRFSGSGSVFQFLTDLPALLACRKAAFSLRGLRLARRDRHRRRLSSTATMVKKQLLEWRTERSRMFSVIT